MCSPDEPDPSVGARSDGHHRDGRPAQERSLDELVAVYLPRLHAYVRTQMGPALRAREGSVDLVQSVCREVLEDRDRFEFRGEAAFLSWLLKAAMNKLRERARFHGRLRRSPDREQQLPDGVLYQGLSPSGEAMGLEEIQRLEAALDQMPEHYREVIVLARILKMPHGEIAVHMGRTVPSVRNLLGRAIAELGRGMGGRPGPC